MIIQWYGQAFIRIESRDIVIAIDPFSKEPKLGITKIPRFRADAVLISHDHADHNNADAIDGLPVVFRGPGEYEIKGVFIQGIPSFHDESAGAERGANTIFTIDAEDLRVCHMGDIGTKKLSEDAREKIGTVDVLFLPVGGTYTVDATGAWDIISALSPKSVIPIHYKVPGLNLPIDGAEKFLKEAGAKPDEFDRLSLRSKDLQADGLKVYLLRPLSFAK